MDFQVSLAFVSRLDVGFEPNQSSFWRQSPINPCSLRFKQGIIMFLQSLPTQGWSDKDAEMLLSEAFMWVLLNLPFKPSRFDWTDSSICLPSSLRDQRYKTLFGNTAHLNKWFFLNSCNKTSVMTSFFHPRNLIYLSLTKLNGKESWLLWIQKFRDEDFIMISCRTWL